jgi:hypothetical protein
MKTVSPSGNRSVGCRASVALAFVVAAVVAAAAPAAAQGACPDGRAANGECIDGGFSNAMRGASVIHSQPKISETHYPILPSQDLRFRYPNQLTTNPAQTPATATTQDRRFR